MAVFVATTVIAGGQGIFANSNMCTIESESEKERERES